MNLKRGSVFYWFFAILPFLVSAAFYSRVPDRIAVHWNGSGIADGYGSKAFGLFTLPVIMFAAAVLVSIMLKIDPRSRNIDRSPQMKRAVQWFLVILANMMNLLIILNALNVRFNMSMIVMALVGTGIAVMGNYLPKCKYNYTMGIRVPWTLASEENWRKTHRMAGPVWVSGGILIALSGLLNWMWLLYLALTFLIVVPIVYSYILSARKNQ